MKIRVPCILAFCAAGIAAPLAGESPDDVHDVGQTEREFVDPERSNWPGSGPRPLRTIVWYPALPDAEAQRRSPLVLLSHGSGGEAEGIRWLGTALAAHGYIVAAVSHNGTNEEELGGILSATDFFAWERARDFSVVADLILEDPVLGPKVDADRIAAAGFSLGGTTAIWLGGARLDLELLRTQSPPPPPFLQASIDELIAYSTESEPGRASIERASQSYRDERIKCIFALAPAMGVGFLEESLRGIHVPVFIVVGNADVVTPSETNAARFAKFIPNAQLVTFEGERGHYTGETSPAKQEAQLAEISELAVEFFNETLRFSPAEFR
jgi:predicted dienelactone hydrolase